MPLLPCIFVLILFLSVTSASTEDQGGTAIGSQGTSPPICTFSSALRAQSAQNMTLVSGGAAGATISIPAMTDGNTATLKPATIELVIPAICNVPHQITLTSSRGALIPTAPTVAAYGQFLNVIKYQATAEWGAETIALSANGGGAPIGVTRDVVNPRRGEMTIQIRIDSTNNNLTIPVVSGDYSDNIIISISTRV